MARNTKPTESHDLQSSRDLIHRSTTSEPQPSLPLTPPAEDQEGRAKDDVQRLVWDAQKQTGTITVRLSKEEFNQSSEWLEGVLRQFDYDPKKGDLTIHMPSPVHDFFAASVANEVHVWLRSLENIGGDAGLFASRVANGGSSRIVLKEGGPDDWNGPVRRQPDAQFQHQGTAYPGLVVEVSYTQDGKDLRKAAQDYILYSNGDIKLVIGIDINRKGKESTVSTWRPKYTTGDDGEILEVQPDIIAKPFRSADGSGINKGERLDIRISDLATDEISCCNEPAPLSVSFDRLAELLTQAEEMQKAREATDDQIPIKSKRLTKKRRLSSSSADELASEDETKFRDRETDTERRAAAEDRSFRAPAKRRA